MTKTIFKLIEIGQSFFWIDKVWVRVGINIAKSDTQIKWFSADEEVNINENKKEA